MFQWSNCLGEETFLTQRDILPVKSVYIGSGSDPALGEQTPGSPL